jgi:hypothetical protein
MDDCHLGCIKKIIQKKLLAYQAGNHALVHSLDHYGLEMTWLWHLLEAVRRRRRRRKQASNERSW